MAAVNNSWRTKSSGEVRQDLYKITGQVEWTKEDQWRFYLKGRGALFKNIAATSCQGLDWNNPEAQRRIEAEFVRRSKKESQANELAEVGQIPAWAVEGDWMDKDLELVQWMRKEHYRNSKEKLKAQGRCMRSPVDHHY
ncbi:MAG: hypothetical protein M1818_006246 [Claussenomyces sp. TS43310]|nr:MAG: hypothetical protein M1818_006246 [Claussenomyces sp. TS43310]